MSNQVNTVKVSKRATRSDKAYIAPSVEIKVSSNRALNESGKKLSRAFLKKHSAIIKRVKAGEFNAKIAEGGMVVAEFRERALISSTRIFPKDCAKLTKEVLDEAIGRLEPFSLYSIYALYCKITNTKYESLGLSIDDIKVNKVFKCNDATFIKRENGLFEMIDCFYSYRLSTTTKKEMEAEQPILKASPADKPSEACKAPETSFLAKMVNMFRGKR